jgi:CelD/BcsL family acetyltransferase involved in cellulose biosynthesis
MHPNQHSVMTSPVHNCRILRSIDDLVAIKSEWERLWAAARADYSLSFSYVYESWNTIHRPQGAEFCCAVAFAEDRLLGALPMVVLRGAIKLLKYAVICSPEAAEGLRHSR